VHWECSMLLMVCDCIVARHIPSAAASKITTTVQCSGRVAVVRKMISRVCDSARDHASITSIFHVDAWHRNTGNCSCRGEPHAD
jgi:hypothetical protein